MPRNNVSDDVNQNYLRLKLAKLDWPRILYNAVKHESRAFSPEPVTQWRNAGDAVWLEVVKALEDAKVLKKPKLR